MDARLTLAAMVVAAGLGCCLADAASPQQRRPTIHDLSLEVAALQALYDFQFTDAQLKLLAKLAPQTREDDRPRPPARVTREVGQALTNLCDRSLLPI